MSQLEAWFRELRDGGMTEAQSLEVIAGRLGEPVIETKRIVSSIAGVKLRGRAQGHGGNRRSGPTPNVPAEIPAGNAGPSGGSQDFDVRALREAYRSYRLAGRSAEQAVKSTARQLDLRPHDVRRVVTATEYALQHPPDSPS